MFGSPLVKSLGSIFRYLGADHVVLITGSRSFTESPHFGNLLAWFSEEQVRFDHYTCSGEPSPGSVDGVTAKYPGDIPSLVMAIGGGSVIDTGKAVSAMLGVNKPVKMFLEGVGTESPPGTKVPFIAVPTTAGTGSEATKNAVLSEVGRDGFKKSLRHDRYVPDYAIIDPELYAGCPPSVTAASGLDAITQLLEGFVSTGAQPLTDQYALAGLKMAGRSFENACRNGADLDARGDMALAAFNSGVVLANAGLGVVHGIAGALGGLRPVPHGAACGTLVGLVTTRIIEKLTRTQGWDTQAVRKYALAGAALSGGDHGSVQGNVESLLDTLSRWIREFDIPALGTYGFTQDIISTCAQGSGLKNTPVELSVEEISDIIRARM